MIRAFVSLCDGSMDEKCMVALLAVLPEKNKNIIGFLSLRGFNTQTPADAAVARLLSSMKELDDRIDEDLDGPDANRLRALQMMAWREKEREAQEGGIQMSGGARTEEDGLASSEALKMYKRLKNNQGVEVPLDDQLQYAAMHRMSCLYKKNGTINMALGLQDMKRQYVPNDPVLEDAILRPLSIVCAQGRNPQDREKSGQWAEVRRRRR